jgi:hypothetical protein
MIDTTLIKQRFDALEPVLDERMRRLWAAAEAKAIGHGGIRAVSLATGVSHRAIGEGVKELDSGEFPPPGKVRQKGSGPVPLEERDPALLGALESLVAPTTRGDPMSVLRWTCKSLRVLADELTRLGHKVSHTKVGDLLRGLGYSLQGNQKVLEGGDHPDRDAQFAHIDEEAKEHLAAGQPVISVDTKKKELVGNYKNGGKEYHPEGKPTEVNVYDFVDENLGRANPYGVYDLADNSAWVSVGMDHDTAAFAVESIRRWWYAMGRTLYGSAHSLMITADGGGSNGSRVRLWKVELQKLSNEIGLALTVCHYPPGTSKWNKIEHRLFSHVTMNWRGRPLVSYEVIVALIAATTTKTGLTVRCKLDKNKYPKGVKISDSEMRAINIEHHEFHGEWNYTILPQVNKA